MRYGPLLACVLATASLAHGGDWPQWRGPFFNGSTDEKNLPSDWSQTLGRVPFAMPTDVAQACDAASAAQRSWRGQSPATYAALLEHWAGLVADRTEEFAHQLALEIGKPLKEGREEIGRAVKHIRAAIQLVEKRGPWITTIVPRS